MVDMLPRSRPQNSSSMPANASASAGNTSTMNRLWEAALPISGSSVAASRSLNFQMGASSQNKIDAAMILAQGGENQESIPLLRRVRNPRFGGYVYAGS